MSSANTVEIQSSKASVGTATSGSVNIFTGGAWTPVSHIAVDVSVDGLESSAGDGAGLAVARSANVNQGYTCEVSYGGGDSVFSIYDSNADLVGTVTGTGFALTVGDRIGMTAQDLGTPAVKLSIFLKRSGSWNELGSVTTSDAGDYREGPYLPGMRLKYAAEIYDDFSAAEVTGVIGSSPALQFVRSNQRW